MGQANKKLSWRRDYQMGGGHGSVKGAGNHGRNDQARLLWPRGQTIRSRRLFLKLNFHSSQNWTRRCKRKLLAWDVARALLYDWFLMLAIWILTCFVWFPIQGEAVTGPALTTVLGLRWLFSMPLLDKTWRNPWYVGHGE